MRDPVSPASDQYGMLVPKSRRGGTPLTLNEVATHLAQRMNCEVEPGEDPNQITVRGNGYSYVVAPFFGGWQATLHLPGKPPTTFFSEAAEMLELRLKAKLAGRDANF